MKLYLNRIGIILFPIVLIGVSYGIFLIFPSEKTIQTPGNTKPHNISCPTQIQTEIVDGQSMEPRIANGTSIQIDTTYYHCQEHDIHHGDIILFQTQATKVPYIKQIFAIPNDTISADMSGGTLTINNAILRNSRGEVYTFSNGELRLMKLYFSSGTLQSGAYLVFGDNTQNSRDSRKFGAISKDAILGKVILP